MGARIVDYAGPALRMSDDAQVDVEGTFHHMGSAGAQDGRSLVILRDVRYKETFAEHDEKVHAYVVAVDDLERHDREQSS